MLEKRRTWHKWLIASAVWGLGKNITAVSFEDIGVFLSKKRHELLTKSEIKSLAHEIFSECPGAIDFSISKNSFRILDIEQLTEKYGLANNKEILFARIGLCLRKISSLIPIC